VDKIGLDAVTFLRFLRMFRWLFTLVALLCCAILVPTDIIYNLRNINSKDRDALSMLTIRGVSGNLLIVHIAVSYLITAVVMFFVYIHWRSMVRLRQAWYRSPEYQETFYARTLVVQQVPKKYQSDEGIRAIFESVQVSQNS
jgi:calcium permeable stress-gated cation channel